MQTPKSFVQAYHKSTSPACVCHTSCPAHIQVNAGLHSSLTLHMLAGRWPWRSSVGICRCLHLHVSLTSEVTLICTIATLLVVGGWRLTVLLLLAILRLLGIVVGIVLCCIRACWHSACPSGAIEGLSTGLTSATSAEATTYSQSMLLKNRSGLLTCIGRRGERIRRGSHPGQPIFPSCSRMNDNDRPDRTHYDSWPCC